LLAGFSEKGPRVAKQKEIQRRARRESGMMQRFRPGCRRKPENQKEKGEREKMGDRRE